MEEKLPCDALCEADAPEERPAECGAENIALPEVPSEAKAEKLPDNVSGELCVPETHAASRRPLFAGLACCVLATLAVLVFGAHAARLARNIPPVRERLLAEVWGVNVVPKEEAEKNDGLPEKDTDASENEDYTANEDTDAGENTAAEENADNIIEVDLSVSSDNPTALINESGYSVDCEALLGSATFESAALSREKYGDDAPLVLIVHTHGTEAYCESAQTGYRSLDPELGVVSVGREMKRIFESHGIGVIHIEEMLDAESFDAAYEIAAERIKDTVAEVPSVCCVLDVHRDAVTATNGALLRPLSPNTVTEDGRGAAQAMLVVGTDAAGSGHVAWRENLAFALAVQKSALGFDPGIMRAVNLRAESFNQQYAPYSIILEVGSAANSVEEARLGGTILAEAISRVLFAP